MKKIAAIAMLALGAVALGVQADDINWWDLGNTKVGPRRTLKEFHEYFKEQFPKMSLQQYALGSYAFNKGLYPQYPKP